MREVVRKGRAERGLQKSVASQVLKLSDCDQSVRYRRDPVTREGEERRLRATESRATTPQTSRSEKKLALKPSNLHLPRCQWRIPLSLQTVHVQGGSGVCAYNARAGCLTKSRRGNLSGSFERVVAIDA